ncbi:exo-beta-N-acetylmuramidase NamZ family protein [Sediminibacterium soli]|uniref:exo-beta-N-acetylmuramidase NamZ family protein n=1 Tax=Sediminibacterium soli TaxID=2698829 RepID=UPI00137969B4|nr:DUF1343 domain-containing protein [Sediminibacterium soli]NCI46493.1 DUF1343 domain-containing protein [Sediminibacterium soli]
MVYFGIDNLILSSPYWKTKRLALLTNEAATTNQLVPSRKALQDNGFNLVKLFSPEHGLSASGADGQLMSDGTDALTGLPVTSLYSAKLQPSAEDLSDIDIVLFDIPDTGARFYTYLWTMSCLLEACAAQGKRLVLLDRPNPVSGRFELAEGPMLDVSQTSFIGRWPLPVRHSCTLGELAVYFNSSRHIGCELEVIRCSGWERTMFWPDWKIPFVPTSPAIQDFQSMLLYPGLCLLEATNVCEGRSTSWSFTSAAAPWIEGRLLADIAAPVLEEVQVRPVSYTPGEAKYAGQLCHGIRLQVREPAYFQPVFTGMLLVKLIRDLYPRHFRWATYPTLVNPEGKGHLDKLLGIPGSEALFDLPLAPFIAQTQKLTRIGEWKDMIGDGLLY